MRFLLQIIRKLPLTTFFSIAIWIVCMVPIPETPLSDVNMIDKWTHLVMFALLSLIVWWELLGCHDVKDKWKILLAATLYPAATGCLIELAQAHLTGGTRSGEWLDAAADMLGVLAALPIGILLAVWFARKRKAQ